MVMTMEVEVEELCRKAVATTPIINPHSGFDNRGFFAKISPAARPLKYRNVSFSSFNYCKHCNYSNSATTLNLLNFFLILPRTQWCMTLLHFRDMRWKISITFIHWPLFEGLFILCYNFTMLGPNFRIKFLPGIFLPPISLNPSLRRSREHMKKYKIVSNRISRTMIRTMVMAFDLGFFTSSVKYVDLCHKQT